MKRGYAQIRVLVVDDDSANLVAMQKLLKPFQGIQVDYAGSGEEALNFITQEDYGLLLLDVRMPEMDGFELAEVIRTDPETARIPIIFVTAELTDLKSTFRGYEVGAVDYLAKPIDPVVFTGKVRVFLDLEQQRCELVSLVHQLREQQELVKKSNQDLERFAYAASHDLRAPLEKVRRTLGLYRHYHEPESEKEEKLLETCDRGLKHMSGLIESLLGLASLRTDMDDGHEVDMRMVLHDVRDCIAHKLDLVGAELDLGSNLMNVRGDETLLNQVFTNLVDNSINYRRNEVPLHIQIESFSQSPMQVQYRITDNGMGFRDEDATRIFDPFSRLVTQKERAGYGLGLAVVRRIIEAFDGQIEAHGKPGEGAEFLITLPAA